jgi:hypothetical protein
MSSTSSSRSSSGLALVALVIFLLWEPGKSAFERIGLDFREFGRDTGRGILLALAIGVPGLALYAAGRAIGITVQVQAAPLGAAWWTVPLLLLAALRAGLTEEVIFIGYLFDRLRLLGWGWWTIILSTAALRGAYHAYQGPGPIDRQLRDGGRVRVVLPAMGRVMPLVDRAHRDRHRRVRRLSPMRVAAVARAVFGPGAVAELRTPTADLRTVTSPRPVPVPSPFSAEEHLADEGYGWSPLPLGQSDVLTRGFEWPGLERRD